MIIHIEVFILFKLSSYDLVSTKSKLSSFSLYFSSCLQLLATGKEHRNLKTSWRTKHSPLPIHLLYLTLQNRRSICSSLFFFSIISWKINTSRSARWSLAFLSSSSFFFLLHFSKQNPESKWKNLIFDLSISLVYFRLSIFFFFLVWLLILKGDNDKINTVPAVSQRVTLLSFFFFFFLSICFFIFYEINERETRTRRDMTKKRKIVSYRFFRSSS